MSSIHVSDAGEPDRDGSGMSWGKVVRGLVGTFLTLLGFLWVAQGADVVRTQPVLCIGDCQPTAGGSLFWFIAGVLTLLAGLWVLGVLRRRPRQVS